MHTLLAVGLLGQLASAPPARPAALRLEFHQASAHNCALTHPRHALPTPLLDSCASLRVVLPTVVGQPGINQHLRAHVLAATGPDAQHPLPLGALDPAGLRQVLTQTARFAQQSYQVQVVTNQAGLLVLRDQWTFDGGGAHPDEGIAYYTYDVARDRALALGDVFSPANLGQLQQLAQAALARQHPTAPSVAPGHQLPLTADFWPTRQGLRLHYNAGELDAVAAGPVEVFLPKAQLRTLVRPGSVVQAYWQR